MCKSLLHIVASDYGREVIKYLNERGCVSNLEISTELGISRQTAMWHLETLENQGLLQVYATVNDKRIPAQFRGAKIRGWVGVEPECSKQAIQRYLSYFFKDNPMSIVQRPEADKLAMLIKKRCGSLRELSFREHINPILKENGIQPVDFREVGGEVATLLRGEGYQVWS